MSAVIPVTIGSNRGWLHHANGARGVVMCAPLGYEALTTHYAWRVLAEQLAAAGLPTLRFDYPGAGDSLGASDVPEWTSHARASIGEATAWLRETLGLDEVVHIGLRLGAALAAEAGGADHLVQLAPVVKGDAYLRELRIMSRMLAASGPARSEKAPAEDSIELEGFVVAPGILASIRDIDLTRLDARPTSRILIFTEPGARGATEYVARLESLGAEVTLRPFENYLGLTPAPTPHEPPFADYEAIVNWAADGARAAEIASPVASPLSGCDFTETVIRFGAREGLTGVLCQPAARPAAAALIMLNTGANAHTGCGRSQVDIARALAAKGVASLRMDVLGIGESELTPAGPRASLYRAARRADVSAAIDWLAAHGHKHFTLVGVCSGATLALHAAAADGRVEKVLLGNIQIFNDLKDSAEIDARLDAAFGATSTYVAKAASADAWARVLRGEVSRGKLTHIAFALARRQAAKLAGAFGLSAHARHAGEALAYFEALSSRGANCLVLHAEHDVGLEEMASLFGANAERLRALRGVRLEIMKSGDHLFASPAARLALAEKLASLIGVDDLQDDIVAEAARMPQPQAVICIPTFHRPKMLETTLASLEAQQTDTPFAVVVVDNDAAGAEGFTVARRIFAEGRVNGVASTEARQGNVHAINAAFGLARRCFPQADYFLMIDDDEYAEPNWLQDMVGAARREKADIVGGPVAPVFPEGAAPPFHDHPVYWPLYTETGPVPLIFGSGNCLIARRVFENLTAPEFDPKFNFLGGGDTEFFTRCRKAGFSFYWVQEARIREQVTPNRLAVNWVMNRSIATGVINYRIDRLGAETVSQRALLIAKNVAIAPVALYRAGRMLLGARHPVTAMHPLGVALGRWLALLGLDPQPYRRQSS